MDCVRRGGWWLSNIHFFGVWVAVPERCELPYGPRRAVDDVNFPVVRPAEIQRIRREDGFCLFADQWRWLRRREDGFCLFADQWRWLRVSEIQSVTRCAVIRRPRQCRIRTDARCPIGRYGCINAALASLARRRRSTTPGKATYQDGYDQRSSHNRNSPYLGDRRFT